MLLLHKSHKSYSLFPRLQIMKIPGDVSQRDLSVTTDSQKLKDAIIVLPWVKL